MLEIRPAALSEFALLPALEAEADAAFEALDPPISTANFPPPGTVEDFAGAFHIIAAGRPPVGFARLEILDGNAHLQQLAVLPDWGRKGVGRALVAAARAWAHEAGFGAMTLTTYREVPFNAPFYESCGFVELPEQEWGPEMVGLRAAEVDAGLDGFGPRIAMTATLA